MDLLGAGEKVEEGAGVDYGDGAVESGERGGGGEDVAGEEAGL